MTDAAAIERYKQRAAERAVELVTSDMVVGLGSGSTAVYATRRIAQLLHNRQLESIRGVATSLATASAADQLGIPLLSNDFDQEIDLTIDGADEISPELHLIKGGGGALLREKIVAQASRRLVIVADDSKLSPTLGARRPVPVEVVQFGQRRQANYLQTLGASVTLRRQPGGAPFITDQGNFILDCTFGPIADPDTLSTLIRARAGIVEHGLFIGLATDVIVAGDNGIRHMLPPTSAPLDSRS